MLPDDFEEQAGILEHDGKFPRPWAEALARLGTAPRPEIYTPDLWARLVNDGFIFITTWLPAIRRNDWTPEDVRGLIPLIIGRAVIAVGRADITVQEPGFAPQKIYHRPAVNGPARWDVGRRAA
ncbi:conserved hypothetical protein [uncultured Gammaproteobacteria bacterium]